MRILVVRNDRMGDLLMSLPALHEVRKAFPQADLTLLIQEELKPLLENHPEIDHIITCRSTEPNGWLNTFRWAAQLKKNRFDVAVVFNPSRLFHIATFLAGVPVRVGYRRKCGFFLTTSRPDDKAHRTLQEAKYNLELTELLGIHPGHPLLDLPTDAQQDRQAQAFLRAEGINSAHRPLAIHPWTSNPTKSWPLEMFQRLLAELDASGEPFILLGGPGEREQMPVLKLQSLKHVVDGVGKISLRLLPSLLKQCRVLVSNDSGPVHVAAGVGTPAIVVAPASHARHLTRWRPLGEKHQVLLDPTVEEVLAAVSEVTAHVSTSS